MALWRRKTSGSEGGSAPTIEALTAAEDQWLHTQREIAGILRDRYLGPTDTAPTIDELEATVGLWQQDGDGRADANDVVLAVGVLIGDHVVAATTLHWVIATDAFGTDLALHAQPGDVLMHPTNSVAKRIGDNAFVSLLYADLLASARRLGVG